MQRIRILLLMVVGISSLIATTNAQQSEGDPSLTEVWNPEPTVVTPGSAMMPPSDAIVLFDGADLSNWQHDDGSAAQWRVGEGVVTVVAGTGDIQTRQSFGDVQLHIEWRTPAFVEGDGQGRGNSGVFLHGRYEVQVLDSYKNKTYADGQAGSIYGQYAPQVNASRPPGQWQTYDIVFRGPKFGKDGKRASTGTITVLHNGILVQDHVINKRGGGTGLISGRKAFQKPMPEGVRILNAIQDVYLSKDVTIA